MQTILSGVRSDGTPLVLVRCACGWLQWVERARGFFRCPLCYWRSLRWPTLAEADAPRAVAA